MRNINDDVTIYDAKAIYFTKRGDGGTLGKPENVGLSTAFKLSLETETKDIKTPGGALIASVPLTSSASASIDLRDMSPANLARGLKAQLVPKSAEIGVQRVVSDPAAGDLVFLDAVNVSNLTVKVGEVAVASSAYILDAAFGVVTFSVAQVGEVTLTYDTAEQNVFSLLTAPNDEYDVKAHIIDLRSNKPRILQLYRVSPTPTKDFDVIGNEFSVMTLELKVLKDETKPNDIENKLGQYGRIIG